MSVGETVVVVGAGAAGIAAAAALRTAGLDVQVLEARERIGGRIFTLHEPGLPIPIELGAEFVYGHAPEVFALAGAHGLPVFELSGQRWWSEAGALRKSTAAAVEVGDPLTGRRLFRVTDGFDRLLGAVADGLQVKTGVPVKRVRWRPGEVALETTRGTITAARAVITVPASVLPSIQFEPEIPAKTAAARDLPYAAAVRVTLRFRDRFWESRAPGLMMLHSADPAMPTWWTTAPLEAPLLAGWAAAERARTLAGQPQDAIRDMALGSLANLFSIGRGELEAQLVSAHVHDWQSDEFSRGAYSYSGDGEVEQQLAAPVERTLFFAGEATNTEGHNGTVHGAVQSGQRAAREVLASWT